MSLARSNREFNQLSSCACYMPRFRCRDQIGEYNIQTKINIKTWQLSFIKRRTNRIIFWRLWIFISYTIYDFLYMVYNFHDAYTSIKVRKRATIRNQNDQAPHLTQDTNGKVTASQLYFTNERQEVSPFPAGGHKASMHESITKTRQKSHK